MATAPQGILAQFDLRGKTAVVTGGARGLGFEMMKTCAELGANCACVDLLASVGQGSCQLLASTYGIKATSWGCDVTSDVQVAEVFGKIMAEHGSIDILITSAGICHNVPAVEYPVKNFNRVMDINITGSFLCAQAAAKYMIEAGKGGSIVFVASMSAHIVNHPQPQAAYNASKAGVIQLGKSLACEWAQYKIRVNSISPGYMETDLTKDILEKAGEEGRKLRATWEGSAPMKRMGQPAELGGVIAFLASNASSFVTGTDILVDGGYTAL
ncbi:hypothetical protein BZG36_04666 [Bifiguratus adelaidae]|uniref:D-arabinitol 2-dehydrogenase [ribulose-forming] n=1 Tax=Bifiguratus adelaidae TaxID=1938954 RepID=A0A261XWL5_9FUNG|nr:hypothetical protein BZG36_04666 [Bifiguratus adelaidae]